MREIPAAELNFAFTRSSGPGGQNVNKTSTKVQLRWHVDSSLAFNADEKLLIKERLAQRLTADGHVAIDSDEERSQLQNKQNAVDRLTVLVNAALVTVTPRRPTRTPLRAKLKRLEHKKQRGQVKRLRQTRHDLA